MCILIEGDKAVHHKENGDKGERVGKAADVPRTVEQVLCSHGDVANFLRGSCIFWVGFAVGPDQHSVYVL